MLLPKLASTLKDYTRAQLVADLGAGVIVGIVALPLAIAFAIASGVTPDRGLYTAVIAGFLISALGGSRVQIGGPTGAFVVIVYGIVQKHGLDGLMLATMMAGVLLIVMGLARLGGAIKFIPHPVVTGFTSGIALIIFSGQVKDLLGLEMGTVPVEFFAKWGAYGQHLETINPQAVALGGLAITIMLLWPRVSRKVPGPFVALLATTVLARLLHLDVETIGSRFGAISSSLPTPVLPRVSPEALQQLMGPAFTIALLAGVESLLSAVVADGMIGGRHRSNMELVAQGVANVVTPLFGGLPATGAIARTATNIKNGGRTPVAGIAHAATLLLITLFFGRWAGYIPFATLAAILVVVAYHMSEWRTFRAEFTAPRSDLVVLLVTFALTVVVDLTVAIQVGMVLAAFLFMRRMAEVTDVRAVTAELRENGDDYETDPGAVRRRAVPAG
ncbi:MAG TPA: SulP family inorganic anion transporter, partial [Longimicrobiaceae bacterium]|nr:SulP family inorganic anion transporter [Longimicrobiaceae bacterium]